jgi:hypothetical protein
MIAKRTSTEDESFRSPIEPQTLTKSSNSIVTETIISTAPWSSTLSRNHHQPSSSSAMAGLTIALMQFCATPNCIDINYDATPRAHSYVTYLHMYYIPL